MRKTCEPRVATSHRLGNKNVIDCHIFTKNAYAKFFFAIGVVVGEKRGGLTRAKPAGCTSYYI
jgi:hypothetical protein